MTPKFATDFVWEPLLLRVCRPPPVTSVTSKSLPSWASSSWFINSYLSEFIATPCQLYEKVIALLIVACPAIDAAVW